MKILVMSLLRLGDIILATPVIKGLREAHPDAEIDLLVNEQFQKIYPLIHGVSNIIPFQREALQKGLTEECRSILESYDRLKRMIDQLNGREYDQIINLTHNRLSGWMMSLIEANEKRGITLMPNGSIHYGSAWFRYLNDYITSGRSDVFHYIDVFYYGTGLSKASREICLQESKAGEESADRIIDRNRPFVAIQPLTSESKKNWGLNKYQESLSLFAKFHPDHEFVILGAPDEEKQLQEFVNKLSLSGLKVRLGICGLDTAYSLLKRASLLLTGDTSIKHLACAAGTRLVELSIGPSFYQKTGAYLEGSVILQSKEPCAPCPHRTPCPYEEHRCGLRVSPELVALTMSKTMTKQLEQLRVVAHEFQDEADILVTEFTENGDWTAFSLAKPFHQDQIATWLDRASWKLLLNKSFEERVPPFGSESQGIKTLLKKMYPEQSAQDWRRAIESIEKVFEHFESTMSQVVGEMKMTLKKIDDPKSIPEFLDRLRFLQKQMQISKLITSYSTTLEKSLEDDGMTGFIKVRRVREALQDMQKRAQIELKLVRSLKSQMTELI